MSKTVSFNPLQSKYLVPKLKIAGGGGAAAAVERTSANETNSTDLIPESVEVGIPAVAVPQAAKKSGKRRVAEATGGKEDQLEDEAPCAVNAAPPALKARSTRQRSASAEPQPQPQPAVTAQAFRAPESPEEARNPAGPVIPRLAEKAAPPAAAIDAAAAAASSRGVGASKCQQTATAAGGHRTAVVGGGGPPKRAADEPSFADGADIVRRVSEGAPMPSTISLHVRMCLLLPELLATSHLFLK